MCTKTQLDIITKKVSTSAKEIFKDSLNSIILFGSYARGDFNEDSDIDIMLIVNMPCDELIKYRNKIDELCGNLLYEYGIVVSIVEKDTETYNKYADILPFYKNIKEEGVKIA